MKTKSVSCLLAAIATVRRRFLPALLLPLVAVVFPVASTHAQTSTSAVPGYIAYQSKVTNANGTLVGAGTPVNRLVIFRIWSHQSNSTVSDLVYSEQQTVTISEGEFSVLVGQGTAVSTTPFGYSESSKGPPTVTVGSLSVFAGATRYLGVTIDDGSPAADPEISPRQQLVSSAFAFRAKYAESLGSNGASTITALDSGNVGIGSANPGAKLEVAGSIRAGGAGITNPQISLLANSATTVAASVGYANSAGNLSSDSAAGDTVVRTENGGKLLLQTGTASSALVIDSSNRVGIGTTSPLTKLDINGVIGVFDGGTKSRNAGISSESNGALLNFGANDDRFGGSYTVADKGGFLRVDTRASDGNTFQFYSRPAASTTLSNVMVISSTGRVGIGTASPTHMLQIGVGANAGPGGLLVNTGWVNSADYTENRPLDVQVRGTSQFVVNSNGNVGIGGNPPGTAVKLSVVTPNTATSSANFRFNNNASTDSWIHYGTTGDIYWRSGASAGKVILQDTGGRVGIGTSNPSAPLHVSGAVTLNNGGSDYFFRNNGYNTWQFEGNFNNDVSILAGSWIQAYGFISQSDLRLKNVLGRSSGATDLQTLLNIEITDYRLKDVVALGNRPVKKVIAQQVEKVFPQAITQRTGVVPDIYEVAAIKDGWAELTTDLKKGERVKLIAENGAESMVEVAEAESRRFRTEQLLVGSKVFVYGREVKDFRTVDYDAISMLNVSATQEIKREKDAEVAALRSANAELTKRVAELEAKDHARDVKLASIEKLLQSPQTVMARPAAAPRANASGQE